MRGVPLHFPPATFANGDDNIRGRCRRVRCRLVSARLITYLTVLGSKSRTVRGRMVFFGSPAAILARADWLRGDLILPVVR